MPSGPRLLCSPTLLTVFPPAPLIPFDCPTEKLEDNFVEISASNYENDTLPFNSDNLSK